MKPCPAISVLMPVYNASPFIETAIRSVLEQSFGDLELLVIDDGSTDDTVERIAGFTDPRIKLVRSEHEGIAAALNRGLSVALSRLVARFDADDICCPGRMQLQFEFMNSHPDHVICGTEADYLDQEGQFVFHYAPPAHTDADIRKVLLRFCPFIHSSVIYRREAVMACGGYHIHAKTFEDHFLWTALLKKGRGANLRESLLRVRLNPSSITMDERWRPERFHVIRAYALQIGKISEAAAGELENIIQKQKSTATETGAYHALLGKKFLWNNFQPRQARMHLRKSISLNPASLPGYLLWAISFLPKSMIRNMYRISSHASHNSAT